MDAGPHVLRAPSFPEHPLPSHTLRLVTAADASRRQLAADLDRRSIRDWHIVISGFTQTLETPCGSQILWNQLRRDAAGHDSAVLLQPWHADWAGVAELIFRFRPLPRRPRVFCYAYSWGAGFGFPELARELGKRGLGIEHAVLSDAVYRPRYRALDWLALVRYPRVLVPSNVRRVDWFYQADDRWIRGHQVVAADAKLTEITPGQRCRATHHYMDDLPAWWLRSLEVAAEAGDGGQGTGHREQGKGDRAQGTGNTNHARSAPRAAAG